MAMSAPAMASTIAAVSAANTNKSSVLIHGIAPCSCSWRSFSSTGVRKAGIRNSARASSSSTSDRIAVGTACTPQIAPQNKISQIGSPLLWVGIGIGLSAWFSVMATKLKRYAIRRAFNSLKGEDAESNSGQFDTTAFAAGGSNAVSVTEEDADLPYIIDEAADYGLNSD